MNMKNIKSITVITALMLSFSCNDALDILPEDSIPAETAYTSVDDLVIGMNGVFSNYFPEAQIRFSSIFSDDTKVGEDNGGQEINFHDFQLTAATGRANSIWTNNYFLINSANRLLVAAAGITPEATEQSTYNNILGECYALRAIAHLDLMAYYSTDYNSATESVPYIDYVVVLEQPSRNTVGEVIAGIKSDLDTANGLIDAGITDNKRITKDVIKAVRARLALYEGDNSTAITMSNDLIGKYPLADQTQYVNMFVGDADNTEVIFKAARVLGDFSAGGIWMFTNSGGSFIEVSNELVSLISPIDVRNNVIWTNTSASTGITDTQERVNKYPGTPGGLAFLNDIKVFRSSEMYLINAEAKARTNDLTGAAMMVQAVRNARFGLTGTPPTYANLLEAITDILAERRLELCFEGHRYIDIKRTRDITNQGINRSEALNDCGGTSGAANCSLAVGDHRFTLPIPAGELDGNPNISQTPGYN